MLWEEEEVKNTLALNHQFKTQLGNINILHYFFTKRYFHWSNCVILYLPLLLMAQKEAKTSEEVKPSAEPAMVIASTAAPAPSWFTPKRLLAIFCVINLLNYVDRGAIASNGVNGSLGTCTESGVCTSGTGIQGDFNLSNFEDGVLSSAFMVGLLLASPIFASLAKSVSPFRLIGVGLSVWTFATIGCGFSFNFWSITLCRMLVGVGEASFISLAAPFIDDNAPAPQKTAWLAIFYMCIPSGYALGYVYGWKSFQLALCFLGGGNPDAPFAILGFVMKPLQLKGFFHPESTKALTAVETAVSEVQGSDNLNGKDGSFSIKEDLRDSTIQKSSKLKVGTKIMNQISRFMKDMKVLLVDKVYVVNVLAYNFVIGAYSYWGPKAGYNIYHMNDADLIFGGITIVCGILGTLAGGFVLDYISSTISNAFKLLSAVTLLGGACCFGAFCFKNMYAFLALFAVGELLVFATQGPVNYICLHCVKPSMRPLSMAISTVSIHLFGMYLPHLLLEFSRFAFLYSMDRSVSFHLYYEPINHELHNLIEYFVFPFGFGLVLTAQDSINNWRVTALILTSIFIPAAGIWFIGIFLHSVDRFNEESENQITTTERSNTTPLLKGKKTETTESASEP
ncbi:Major facilitator superfamily protein [Prunus dulcis]|uniref:Major facilitator superfamily protein n=1 Tax=Prunus dulcis TaxID=3755 RepID=A0A4Y1RY38_PRUDU|nr:Major facilitator superfamily protein [Prunus dulcis]